MIPTKHARLLTRLGYVLAGALAAWAAVRFVLPWLAPFLLAFATAALLEPAVAFLHRKCRFRRWFAAGACALVLFLLLIAALAALAGRAAERLPALLAALPGLLGSAADAVRRRSSGFAASLPPDLAALLQNVGGALSASAADAAPALTRRALELLSGLAGAMPRLLLAVATYAVGVFFLSAGYPEVKAFLLRQLPAELHRKARTVRDALRDTLQKWLRTQCLLTAVTFGELTLTFAVLRLPHAVLLAAGTALVDALPVLGVGTVLLPWAAIELLTGSVGRGIGLLLAYILAALVRSFLEPKLLGRQMGLHPAAAALAVYAGFCLAGVGGMIAFPILLMLAKQLNDLGYVRLWK